MLFPPAPSVCNAVQSVWRLSSALPTSVSAPTSRLAFGASLPFDSTFTEPSTAVSIAIATTGSMHQHDC